MANTRLRTSHANCLVTGANRGIGLEICRQWKARGAQVIATSRASSPELEALDVRRLNGVDRGGHRRRQRSLICINFMIG